MAVQWIEAFDLTDRTNPDAESAALAASWILYKLSGEKYPGKTKSTDWYGTDVENFQLGDYFSTNLSQYTGYPTLSGVNVFEIRDYTSKTLRLRGTPILSIEAVAVGNEVLDSSKYVIVNKAYLMRTDGLAWDYRTGVTVSYTHGVMPPQAGIRAAQRLGDELVLSVTDPAQCSLPDRVTSVDRQGLSFTILDPQDFIDDGRTGMYEVDLFIKTANPIKARKRPRVYSPDIPSGRRQS
jgi:hypothetical protein